MFRQAGRRCLKWRTRAADAPYVPELQTDLDPVAGLRVPGLDNGYLPEMNDRPDRPAISASQGGSPAEPPRASLLGTNATGPHPMGQHPMLRSSAGAGRTHVDNILVSLSHPRPPSAWAAVQPQARRETPLEAAPPQPQAPTAVVALRPAAAAAAAAAAAGGFRPAPIAGPSVSPPGPGGTGRPFAPPAGPAGLPRSAGAAAAARALATLAPGPVTPTAPPGPVGTGAQDEPLFSNAAASSAARALSNLAGAAARAASARTTPPADDGPARTTLVTGDGHSPNGHGLGPHAPNRHVPNDYGPDGHGLSPHVPDGPDLDMAPGTDDGARAGNEPGAQDSEVPQADPQHDDILPAKSKSFFRLRR
jgi:hypothetical protein